MSIVSKKRLLIIFQRIISDDFEEFLLDKEDTLFYLYVEYMEDDTANIHNEIEGFVSNLCYRFRTQSEMP